MQTTISLDVSTRARLMALGAKGETYDDVLNRLLNQMAECQASHQHYRQRAAVNAKPAAAGKE